MTNAEIRSLALACGFTLRLQPDGTFDLNPYVYEFARRLLTTKPLPIHDLSFEAGK